MIKKKTLDISLISNPIEYDENGNVKNKSL